MTFAAPRSIIFSMLAALLVRWALLGVAFAVTAWLLSGMDISGGFWGYVWVSALFGIVNAIIGTILRIITLPLQAHAEAWQRDRKPAAARCGLVFGKSITRS